MILAHLCIYVWIVSLPIYSSMCRMRNQALWSVRGTNQDFSGRPATFEEAVDWVAARIQPDTVSNPYFHHSSGMLIRNELGLWQKESPLSQHMLTRFGLCHADDTGMLSNSWVSWSRRRIWFSPKQILDEIKINSRHQKQPPAIQ
jgi:hypothetical protein